MKYQELQAVHRAVEENLRVLLETKGESRLVGLEGFSPKQLEKFDQLWDYFSPKAWATSSSKKGEVS